MQAWNQWPGQGQISAAVGATTAAGAAAPAPPAAAADAAAVPPALSADPASAAYYYQLYGSMPTDQMPVSACYKTQKRCAEGHPLCVTARCAGRVTFN